MTEGSPSIDRIDNNGGYTVDNIAVISWRANRLKNNATSDELRQIAEWMDSYAHPGGNLIGAPNTERQCVEGRAESVHDMPAMFASSEEKT
jgi:hypothetical protein